MSDITEAFPESFCRYLHSYASEAIQSGDVSRIPGVEIHNPRQQVWQKAPTSTPVPTLDSEIIGSSLLVANNVAEIR